jgi:hypothetical protein
MSIKNVGTKNLILGAVANYEFEQIEPFISSIKKTGFQGDVCLCLTNVSQRTIDLIQQHGVKVQLFDKFEIKIPYINKTIDINNPKLKFLNQYYPLMIKSFANLYIGSNHKLNKFKIAQKIHNIYTSRYFMYYLVLSSLNENYSNIMLTDVRDVVFQRDPFDFDINDNLSCFLESENYFLNSCPFNSNWILQAFGSQALSQLEGKPISCSGVTIGSFSKIMNYLEVMLSYLVNLKVHISGIDQGVHNYIIHNNLINDIKLFANGCSPVLTMGYYGETIEFNQNEFILQTDGSIPCVLHQYDRHPETVQKRILTKVT